jgi:phosphoserine phosphatase
VASITRNGRSSFIALRATLTGLCGKEHQGMYEQILASWRPGATRSAIVDFTQRVCTGSQAISPEARIAVFDNDGTLWTEKPLAPQLHYVILAWAEAARADSSLAGMQPYRSAVTGDYAWLGAALDKHYAGDDADLQLIIAALLTVTDGMSVEAYEASITDFYRNARHLSLDRTYAEAVYEPMVELLRYLDVNDFTCYIVSGGDRDFMRPMTMANYGIPPERVIGSAVGLSYADGDVRYSSTFSFLDDGPEKPVRIWSRIGRRPILAAGNSNGDIPMLEYVKGNTDSLSLLISHDDDTGRGDAPYSKGAESALAAGFTCVSVRDDWERVFVGD